MKNTEVGKEDKNIKKRRSKNETSQCSIEGGNGIKREVHCIGVSWIKPQVVPLESCMTLGSSIPLFVHHSSGRKELAPTAHTAFSL